VAGDQGDQQVRPPLLRGPRVERVSPVVTERVQRRGSASASASGSNATSSASPGFDAGVIDTRRWASIGPPSGRLSGPGSASVCAALRASRINRRIRLFSSVSVRVRSSSHATVDDSTAASRSSLT
jgi:hypothetical protein